MKIMLDAGHGGNDSGACNGGYYESVYALEITKRLGTLLTAQGFTVGYTRTDDTYIGINTRYKTANSWGAGAFVSIHLNSGQASASGIETLVYKTGGNADALAQKVQAQLIDATGAKNRGVKVRTDLGVLRGTDMPAILVETGFISNDEECAKLITAAYQQTLVEAMAKGICAWAGIAYGINYKETTTTAATTATEDEDDMTRYEKLKDIPNNFGFRDVIDTLMTAGIINGDGSDKDGNKDVIDLSHDQVRSLVFEYRGGAFDRKLEKMGLEPAVSE